MTASAIAELKAPSRVACSDLLDHVIVITQKIWNARNKPTAQIKLPAPSKMKTAMRLLPRNSLKNPAAAKANPKTGTPAGFANAKAPIPNTTAKSPKKMLMVSSGLTSRAQARGTNQREPRSGTGSAIPRCLQRFVRPLKNCLSSFYHNLQSSGGILSDLSHAHC